MLKSLVVELELNESEKEIFKSVSDILNNVVSTMKEYKKKNYRIANSKCNTELKTLILDLSMACDSASSSLENEEREQ